MNINSDRLKDMLKKAIDYVVNTEQQYKKEIKQVTRSKVQASNIGSNSVTGVMVATKNTKVHLSQSAILDTVVKTAYYANVLSKGGINTEVKLMMCSILNIDKKNNIDEDMPELGEAKTILNMIGKECNNAEFDFENNMIIFNYEKDPSEYKLQKINNVEIQDKIKEYNNKASSIGAYDGTKDEINLLIDKLMIKSREEGYKFIDINDIYAEECYTDVTFKNIKGEEEIKKIINNASDDIKKKFHKEHLLYMYNDYAMFYKNKLLQLSNINDDHHISLDIVYNTLANSFKGNIEKTFKNIKESITNIEVNINIAVNNMSSNEIDITVDDVYDSNIEMVQHNESRLSMFNEFNNFDKVNDDEFIENNIKDKLIPVNTEENSVASTHKSDNINQKEVKQTNYIYYIVIVIAILIALYLFYYVTVLTINSSNNTENINL